MGAKGEELGDGAGGEGYSYSNRICSDKRINNRVALNSSLSLVYGLLDACRRGGGAQELGDSD